MKNNDYLCDCDDCWDREDPCDMDCEYDMECVGCAERKMYKLEVQFEIDKGRGLK